MKTSWLALMAMCCAAARAAEIRYDDVLYLDELKQPALEMKVLDRTALLFSRDARSVIAHLAKGQSVTLIGFGEKLHYVAAQIVTGPARGWVAAEALEAPPASLVEELKRRKAKALEHRALIERHEIVVGMTPEEVEASLGKPERKARLRTQTGEEEQWFYITYRYVPHYQTTYDSKGQPWQSVVYFREPAGHKIVTFRGGLVVEIAEEAETKRPRPGNIVLPQPPVIY
jgi:hypothetical protein